MMIMLMFKKTSRQKNFVDTPQLWPIALESFFSNQTNTNQKIEGLPFAKVYVKIYMSFFHEVHKFLGKHWC